MEERDPVLGRWLSFMGYEQRNKTYQSPILNPLFFMNQDGAKDANKELTTAIEIFSGVQASSDSHPQCLYPARYEILRRKFPLAPPVACPNFDSWKRNYEITNVNVLYGSQYISNPTSAFGHAFFLIDSNSTMEYARATFNYGADIPANVGARLVVDGLFGGFRGNFSVVPLYHRLHSYNDIENRDIWEYTLALTTEERDFLMKYLWEVQGKYSAPYYFLTGNCASVILDMLNIVRPGLNLKTSSPFYTSPQEIFRVLHQEGLVASVKYRPSLEKQLDQKLKRLSRTQIEQFKNIFHAGGDLPRDPLLAETVMSFIQFQRQKNQGITPENLKLIEKKALVTRAEIPEVQSHQVSQAEWPPPPHEAQGPQLLSLGRSKASSGGMTTFVFRPAFHDLMQTDAGFLTDSSIDVLTVEGRIPDGREPRLEALTLGKIVNFREIKMYDPLATSWMLGGQIVRNSFVDSEDQYYLIISTDMGFASRMIHSSFLVFALAGLDFREGEYEPFGKFGGGPRIGMIGTFGRLKIFSSYRLSWQSPEAKSWQKRATEIKIRYNLNQQWDLLSEWLQEETAHREAQYQELSASLRYSF